MELRGESVVLRPLRAEDAPRLAKLAADPEVAGWWPDLTKPELVEKAQGKGDSTGFAILHGEELSGLIQYYEEDDPTYRHAGIDLFLGADGVPWVTAGALLPGAHISVRPPGVSKWAGVLAWCADQGIDPAHVLAVGDGENDLELLAAARVACVVSDGCEAALALADHVIEPAEQGGWCEILELLG